MTELEEPDLLAIVPACEGHGNRHRDDECHEHGWALVYTAEDDPPFLESPHREVLEEVVRAAKGAQAWRQRYQNLERSIFRGDVGEATAL